MKKLVATALTVVTAISCLSFTASAKTNWLSAPRSYPSSYTTNTCTVCTSIKKNAYVTVQIIGTTGSTLDVKMVDQNNRAIWSENNAIKITKNSAWYGTVQSRKFTLGTDHSTYKLAFRQRSGCSDIGVTGYGKCTVK